jgi:hypothetical protein
MTAMVVLGFYESLTFAVIAALGWPPSFSGVLMSVQAAGSILGGLATARSSAASARPAPSAPGSPPGRPPASSTPSARCPPPAPRWRSSASRCPLYAAALSTASQRFTPRRLQGRTGAATTMLANLS